MPRMDKTDSDTLATLHRFGCEPDEETPIDLCIDCFDEDFSEFPTIQHPPYEERKYFCMTCGMVLTEDDNENNEEDDDWQLDEQPEDDWDD